ncbi:hypothetical protein [Streptomyces sp. WG7]|uniref:hypothetical protein n=1 Tax=Streptomyces sp. WG7 TaxID=3417650 RepID=UPI003CEEB4E4
MTSCPVDIVLSLCREETSRLLRTMRSHHVMPAYAHPWGSAWAYLTLLRSPRPMVLLDVPDGAAMDELEQRVHVLSKFSSVVVLTPRHTDVVAVLRAGAINALPRDTSPRELASRIAAERRWLGFSAPRLRPRSPALPDPEITCHQLSQRVLFEVLSTTRREWCCHELCLLLGTPLEPMSRRALQGRMARLDERVRRRGVSIGIVSQWGRTVYTGLHEAAPRTL